MVYIRADCGKCTRVIKNSKGYFCIALGKFIDNYEVTGNYQTKPNSNVVINTPEKDRFDPKCNFNPNKQYNSMDYVEPLESIDICRDNY